MSLLNLISLVGLIVFGFTAWVLGGFRRPVAWSTVLGSGLLMLALGSLIFLFPPTRSALAGLNDLVVAVLGASRAGAIFLFGPLGLNPGETVPTGETSIGLILAVQVFPAVIFFSSLMAVLYHLGLIQPVVLAFARLFKRSLKLSGAESLAASLNIFFGIESAIAVRPYLEGMTRSELLTLLTCCMCTVASTVLPVYVSFLENTFPQVAGHLMCASVLSVPAAAAVSKLMLPETGEPETLGSLPPMDRAGRSDNTFAALASGAWEGLKLVAGIAALLIAVLGVVALLNLILGKLASPLQGWLRGDPLSLEGLFGWLFLPPAFLLGLDPADIRVAGQLLGKRVILTEVVAYQELGRLAAAHVVSQRGILVLTYALCGFTHVASLGIFVGGIAAMAPSRRNDLTALAFRALAAATLACLMTGAVAGLFYTT